MKLLSNRNMIMTIITTLVTLLSLYKVVEAQQEQNSSTQQQQQQQVKGFLPLVNVDNQSNKSRVDVHVPIWFNMLNEQDKNTGQSKLDLSVMNGLVTVNRDKERKPDGSLSGPLVVTVFGIPVYQGSANRRLLTEPLIRGSIKGRKSLEDSLMNLSNQSDSSILQQVSENLKKINDRTIKSIADTFNRITTFISEGSGSVDSSTSINTTGDSIAANIIPKPTASATININNNNDRVGN